MKTNQKNNYSLITKVFVLFLAMSFVFVSACKEDVDPTKTDTVKPEAVFTFTAAELVVTFINTSKGAHTFAWDFGDGQKTDPAPVTDDLPAVVITYATEGTYDVKLTVTRDNGQSHELVRQVTVSKTPVASFSAASVGLVTTFTNESANATTYEWNFGDATPISTEASPVHTFANSGTYTVNLVAIKGALRHEYVADVTVIAPIAGFDYSLTNLVVTFTNTSENATSYMWDFGDGSTSTEESPTHSYANSAQYSVKLVATADDTATDEITVDITVAALPVANYSYSGTALALTFTNTSTDAVSYTWDFGDGNTSTVESPNNTYASAGVYMVVLTAIGQFGDESELRQWVTVDAAGAPYAGFRNGTFDDYGDPTATDYQKNNDDWEDPDHWTGTVFDRAGGMSSDGKKLPDGTKTNGLKMKNNNTRGGYQEVAVESGQSYTVTFDVAGDLVAATNVRLDAYVLNARIFKEDDPVAGNTYMHFPINDSELTGKGNFITKSITFTATTDVVTFYMLETVNTFDGATEVWVDNVVLTKN